MVTYLVKKYGSTRQYKNFMTLMPEEVGEIEKKKYKKVRLPKEFISFPRASAGLKMTPIYKVPYNYLKQRNVTNEMMVKFNIGFCYEGEYKNRIIIPSYDEEGGLNYFTGRSWETKPYLKYKNPEAEKDKIIFNEKLIDWKKDIYLVEGVFDGFFLENSIPMLGKHMSEMLFDKVYNNAKGNVIIALDGDAWNSAIKLYHELNGGELYEKIKIVKLPKDQDVCDLGGNINEYFIEIKD
jgi:DNA primase